MCNQLEARGQEPILRGKGSTVMMVKSEAHIILDCPSSHAGGHSLNTLPDVAWRRTPRKMQIAKSGSEHTFKVRDNCLRFPQARQRVPLLPASYFLLPVSCFLFLASCFLEFCHCYGLKIRELFMLVFHSSSWSLQLSPSALVVHAVCIVIRRRKSMVLCLQIIGHRHITERTTDAPSILNRNE